MIDNKNKVIFIAIPKTGTTSIEKIFFNTKTTFKNGKHDSIFESYKKMEKSGLDPSIYYKFTVVRNPYERIKSCYRYILKRLKYHKKKLPKDFNSWLENPYGDEEKLWAPQTSFIDDSVVWFKIEKDWESMIKSVSKHVKPKNNTNLKLNTTHDDGSIVLDNNSIKLINSMYKEDFLKFDYDMIKEK